MNFLTFLKERFGFAGVDEYQWLEKGNKAFVLSKELEAKGIYSGLLAGKRTKFGWKPTTDFLQLFGKYARKNIVEVSRDEAQLLFEGKSIPKKAQVEEGYVVLKITNTNVYVGCGVYLNGRLISQIPKHKRF